MATHFVGPVISTNGFQGNLTLADPLSATGVTASGAISGATVAGTTSVTIGGGTAITKVLKGTVTIDPADIASSGTVGETSVTVTGAVAGDTVIMNAPAAIEAGCVWSAFVSASNTVKLRIANLSGGALNVASADWTYTLIRS